MRRMVLANKATLAASAANRLRSRLHGSWIPAVAEQLRAGGNRGRCLAHTFLQYIEAPMLAARQQDSAEGEKANEAESDIEAMLQLLRDGGQEIPFQFHPSRIAQPPGICEKVTRARRHIAIRSVASVLYQPSPEFQVRQDDVRLASSGLLRRNKEVID